MISQVPDIKHRLILNAPISKVWDTVATAEGLALWLMENTFVPKLGAAFTMKSSPRGNWDGTIQCEVTVLEKPHVLAFTWNGGGLDNLLVTIELKDLDGKTEFKLTHSGWSEHTKPIRELLDEGWVKHCFVRLTNYVEGN
ncbi:SRPBCC domain-containing protein [Bacillus sp. 165]|uniref:SRPBCC family protein n=1 Tax=Bacillus sp. 165 TaxID=1529117 RepID=UPI001AD98C19|nr:SRPBCC domain-containing protein [Bacillus sp. 165]MBO9129506.1 SRPBCC domain-containing protein [Bacillus sp. 165]